MSSVAFVEAHITGSSLVHGVAPNDLDICVLFKSLDDMETFMRGKDLFGSDQYSAAGKWGACRVGNKNYICTADKELYYRTKAFSTALKKLQLKNKEDRVALAIACMDDEPEYVNEI